MSERTGPDARRGALLFSRAIVALRHVVVAGWIAAAIAMALTLPGLGGSADLELPLPDDAAPLAAEQRSAEIFGAPLISRTQVVVSRPGGLSVAEQAALAQFALDVSRRRVPSLDEIAAAVPLPSAGGVAPGARDGPSSILTYLGFESASIARQERLGRDYIAAAPVPDNASAGLTGSSAIREDQFDTINDWLPIVVGVTLALIVLVVAVVFRSLVAPFVVLGTVAVAYLVDIHAIGAVAEATGIAASRDIEPVVSALLIGIVTDYAIFYLFGVRSRLARGDARQAAVGASAHMVAIVVTAGLITALGTATLLVGDVDFFRAFAPALALTAVVGVVVSITLLPALLAILGRGAFWPRRRLPADGAAGARQPRAPLAARLLTRRAVAGLTVVVLAGGLAVAASPLRDLELGLGLTGGDASSSRAVEAGFVAGVTAPTEVLVEGPGATDAAVLARLRDRLRERPGVADVVGPSDPVPRLAPPVFVAPQARASRFIVVLDSEPTEHTAIQRLDAIERALPGMLADSGAPGARASLAGDTAIASASVDAMRTELLRVGIAALVVNFLLLALFLRALVAPLYLLAANALTVAATLGITTWVFQDVLDQGQLVYYVPFATSVLLLALGSDYTIYLVGGIWRVARRVGIVQGVREAMPAASRGISVAGLVLAGSFGVLALVPMDAMRQLAFVMALGVALDAFVVRPLLVPALITLVGRRGFWPSAPAPAPAAAPSPPTPGGEASLPATRPGGRTTAWHSESAGASASEQASAPERRTPPTR
ncbi:MAG TPA: MMPL family transporter [Miltoncostaeaceae bacterium]|nr:MMPL family transporter [Miltoncostaeaceae bacterium]